MRYEKHDFRKNFLNATGSQDSEMTRELILDEISTLVVRYPIEVSDVIKESGITIKADASTNELIKVLSKNLPVNKKLPSNLMKLIIAKASKASPNNKKKKMLMMKGWSNAEGDFGKFISKKENIELVESGVLMLANIFGRKKRQQAQQAKQTGNTKQARNYEKEAQDTLRRAEALMRKQAAQKQGKKGTHWGWYVGSAVLLAGIGTTVYFVLKNKGKAKSE